MADRNPALATDSGFSGEPAIGGQGELISGSYGSDGPPKLPV